MSSYNSEVRFNETPFDILGVSFDASDELVKARFRHLTILYHPDQNKSPNAEEKFLLIRNAYEDLKDAESRQRIIRNIENNVYRKTNADVNDENDAVYNDRTSADGDERIEEYVDLNNGKPLFRLPKKYKKRTSFGLEQAEWIIKNKDLLERFVEIRGNISEKSKNPLDKELKEYIDSSNIFIVPALGRQEQHFVLAKAEWIVDNIDLFEIFVNSYCSPYNRNNKNDIEFEEEYENSYVGYYNGSPVLVAPRVDWGKYLQFGLKKAEWIIENIDLIKKFVEIHENDIKFEEKNENDSELEDKVENYHHHNFGRPIFIMPHTSEEENLQFGLNKAEWIIENIDIIKKFVENYRESR